MMLERAGYRVAVAAEPQQALRKMAEEQPDLVITDLMMASLDSGFSFARTIKEDLLYGDIPVIIASSVSSSMGLDFRPRTADETAQMKVDAYFDKPLAPDKLLAKIEELLTARRVRAAGAAASPPDTPDPVNRAPAPGRRGRLPARRRADAYLGQPPHHHHRREVPHVLRLCPRVPGQGHPSGRRPSRVIYPRCIGCGNCVLVCSQNAKQVLENGRAGCCRRGTTRLPYSHPASRPSSPRRPPGRGWNAQGARGSTSVHEISFGADLVAPEYRGSTRTTRTNATSPHRARRVRTCASITPDSCHLAPIGSPMVATARVTVCRPRYQGRLHGPLRRKEAGVGDATNGEVDAVLTFAELRKMFGRRASTPKFAGDHRFDPPRRSGSGVPLRGRSLAGGGADPGCADGEWSPQRAEEFIEAITEFDL